MREPESGNRPLFQVSSDKLRYECVYLIHTSSYGSWEHKEKYPSHSGISPVKGKPVSDTVSSEEGNLKKELKAPPEEYTESECYRRVRHTSAQTETQGDDRYIEQYGGKRRWNEDLV